VWVSTPMVGACHKNGIFYALAQDDLSAGPVWQTQITTQFPNTYDDYMGTTNSTWLQN